MNLGVYVPSLGDHDLLREINHAISHNIKNHKLSDASIFYDNVAFQPFNFNCGLFNSTDLWNFNGKLITTSLATCVTTTKIVNKIDIFYYYGFEKNVGPLQLIFLQKEGVKFIARSQDSYDDLYRKTANSAINISYNFTELLDNIR